MTALYIYNLLLILIGAFLVESGLRIYSVGFWVFIVLFTALFLMIDILGNNSKNNADQEQKKEEEKEEEDP